MKQKTKGLTKGSQKPSVSSSVMHSRDSLPFSLFSFFPMLSHIYVNLNCLVLKS